MQNLLSVTLKSWFEQFGRILAEPLTAVGSEWGVKLEVLRLLTLLAGRFTRVSAPHMPAIMAQSWQLFVGEAFRAMYSKLWPHVAQPRNAESSSALLAPGFNLLLLCSAATVEVRF